MLRCCSEHALLLTVNDSSFVLETGREIIRVQRKYSAASLQKRYVLPFFKHSVLENRTAFSMASKIADL